MVWLIKQILQSIYIFRYIHQPLNKNQVGNIMFLLLNLVQDIFKKLWAKL